MWLKCMSYAREHDLRRRRKQKHQRTRSCNISAAGTITAAANSVANTTTAISTPTATMNNNEKQILRRFVSYFDFASMNVQFFRQFVHPLNIVKGTDVIHILSHFCDRMMASMDETTLQSLAADDRRQFGQWVDIRFSVVDERYSRVEDGGKRVVGINSGNNDSTPTPTASASERKEAPPSGASSPVSVSAVGSDGQSVHPTREWILCFF